MKRSKASEGSKPKIIRATTIGSSLGSFCAPMLPYLVDKYDIVVVSNPDEALERMSHLPGVRTIGVPMQRHIAPLSDLRSLWRMYRLMRRERPWLVHSMTPKAGLICMLAARLAGVPNRMHTFTGLIWPTSHGLKRSILKAMDRLLCSCATVINPEGRGVRDDMVRGGITRRSMVILGHGNVRGIDPEYYNPEDPGVLQTAKTLRRDDPEASMVYVFVGRLVADKGIAELVRAFADVYDKDHGARLWLVGRTEDDLDPLDKDTRDTIASHPGIRAFGEQADVRPYLVGADAFVFPSHREGFPNVVLEAGAMGLPSIVTDINGSREIIENHYNGVIVAPGDAKALEAAMDTLRDSSVRARMAGHCRDHVLRYWSASQVRQALLNFYAGILQGSKTTTR